MQLSVPTFPVSVKSAGPTIAASGKPNDSASSGAPAFGELLSAQTKASAPARSGTTTSAKTSSGPDSDAALADDAAAEASAESEDSRTASDDQPSRQAVIASWLMANGLIPNPTASQELNRPVIDSAGGVDGKPIAESTDAGVEGARIDNVRLLGGLGEILGGTGGASIDATGGKSAAPGGGQGMLATSQSLVADAAAANSGVPVDKVSSRKEFATALPDGAKAQSGTDATAATSTTPLVSGSDRSASPVADAVGGQISQVTTGASAISGAPENSKAGRALSAIDQAERDDASSGTETGALDRPRGQSASANAIRVHAAIEQARAQNLPPGALLAEKFAGQAEQLPEAPAGIEVRGLRKLFTVDTQKVGSGYGSVGINVAKAETPMPALTTSTPSPSGATEPVSFSAAAANFESLVNSDASNAALVSGARRAVESAVAMSERFSSTDRSSVNLHFSVSGVDLAVRVEMRADGVHTTFRTDSPELRAALAHEWQTVAAQTPDRPVRLAEPTFSSNSAGNGTQPDANSAHQRQPGTRTPDNFAESFGGSRTTSRPQPAAAIVNSLPVIAAAAPGRLHTFA